MDPNPTYITFHGEYSLSIEKIARYVSSKTCKLERLTLFSCNLFNIEALIDALQFNATLRHLDLRNNNIPASAYVKLFQVTRLLELDCLLVDVPKEVCICDFILKKRRLIRMTMPKAPCCRQMPNKIKLRLTLCHIKQLPVELKRMVYFMLM